MINMSMMKMMAGMGIAASRRCRWSAAGRSGGAAVAAVAEGSVQASQVSPEVHAALYGSSQHAAEIPLRI
jgi:hypothetical protein